MEKYVFDPKNLKNLIQVSGLTTEELAAASGLSLNVINRFIDGKKSTSIRPFVALSKAFGGVSLDFLLGLTDEETTAKILDKFSHS